MDLLVVDNRYERHIMASSSSFLRAVELLGEEFLPCIVYFNLAICNHKTNTFNHRQSLPQNG